MVKAREIAEERLAKGEISEEEFDRLVSKLSNSEVTNIGVASEEEETNSEMPKGSVFWGIAGLIGAVVLYSWGSDISTDIINTCVSEGRGSFEFCKENGVKWPIIYLIYGFAIFMGIYGIINFFLPKK